jgi:hypothetical protein
MHVTKILNKTHTIKKDFANLKAGESVYCFSQTDNCFWIILPKPWHGITQIKVSKQLFVTLL